MAQSKQAKPKGYQDITKLGILYVACGYMASNLSYFMPRWPLLEKILDLVRFAGVAYLLKKPGESIGGWIKRSCGKKFNFSKVLKTLLCFTVITLLPVIYKLLTSSMHVYTFGMYSSSILHHIFNASFFWVLVPLRMIQTFVEEWFFRRPLMGNNAYKDHLISILLFSFLHSSMFFSFDTYARGAFFFFMMSIQFTLPVMLFNCLEYSWGLHLAHNLMVDFFLSPGTSLFSWASSFNMGFYLRQVVTTITYLCAVFAAAFWQKDSLKLVGSKAREVKSEQIKDKGQRRKGDYSARANDGQFTPINNVSPQMSGG